MKTKRNKSNPTDTNGYATHYYMACEILTALLTTNPMQPHLGNEAMTTLDDKSTHTGKGFTGAKDSGIQGNHMTDEAFEDMVRETDQLIENLGEDFDAVMDDLYTAVPDFVTALRRIRKERHSGTEQSTTIGYRHAKRNDYKFSHGQSQLGNEAGTTLVDQSNHATTNNRRKTMGSKTATSKSKLDVIYGAIEGKGLTKSEDLGIQNSNITDEDLYSMAMELIEVLDDHSFNLLMSDMRDDDSDLAATMCQIREERYSSNLWD